MSQRDQKRSKLRLPKAVSKRRAKVNGSKRAPKNSDLNKPASQDTDPSVVTASIVRFSSRRRFEECTDVLAREEPLEIRVRGRSVAVTMRTPGHDHELAAGFLLSEGIIHNRSEIVQIAPCAESDQPQNTLNIFLAAFAAFDLERLTRHVFASSSCGLCGKASIEAVHQHFPPVDTDSYAHPRILTSLPEKMRTAQAAFSQTGGLHAAGIFDLAGNLVVLREDIGRHNAVDKVTGFGLLENKLPFNSHVLLVSGRASFEIMQKALAARIAIVAAVSAPSSLALEFARESGQTLIGFLRGDTMNVYSRADRLIGQ